MQIAVETHKDARGVDIPHRIHMDGRCMDVARIVDEWHGKDYSYFKLLVGDGDLYVLRFDDLAKAWDLTLFESARARIVTREVS